VRRQRDGCGGRGVGAAHAFARQPVDRRRLRQAEAVAPEPVGPQRVDGDDEDVRPRSPLAAAREREQRARRQREPRQDAFAVPDLPCFEL
jgi:hypothetical protein